MLHEEQFEQMWVAGLACLYGKMSSPSLVGTVVDALMGEHPIREMRGYCTNQAISGSC